MPIIPYTASDDAYIIANYATLGPRSCARQLNRTSSSVYYRSKILGLPRVTLDVRNRLAGTANAHGDPTSEVKVVVETFSKVATPEVAYLLGLLWADGYVHPNKVVLSCLRADALDYMSAFEATGTWRVHDYQYYRYNVPMQPSRVIQLGHTGLATYLRSHGYASKSSDSACVILSTIPEHLKHYWVRGLFDGDGYIGYGSTGSSWVKLTSSYEQNWKYLEDLCQKLNIVYKISRDRYTNRHGKVNSRSVFSITNAIGVKRFCDYIYSGREQDGLGLRRKYAKWLELVSCLRKRPQIGHIFA